MLSLKKTTMIAASGLVFLLAGCTTVTHVQGAKKNEYYVRCSMFSSHKKECYERAAKVCPGGYRLIRSSTPAEAFSHDVNQGPAGQQVRKDTVVGITIQCK